MSLSMDSSIEMADESFKWLSDIRIGDMVRGRTGAAEVLGIRRSPVGDRGLYEIAGAVVCTPGHLFVASLTVPWAVPDREAYRDGAYGQYRFVKGATGLIRVHNVGPDPDDVTILTTGTPILKSDGGYLTLALTTIITPVDTELPEETVIALHLDGSDIFFADGFAVGTLGG